MGDATILANDNSMIPMWGMTLLSVPEYAEDQAMMPEAELPELSDEELAEFSGLLLEALTLPPPPIIVIQ